MRAPNLTPKQRTLIYLSFTLLILILLASGLSGLALEKGEPITFNDRPYTPGVVGSAEASDFWLTFIRGLLSLSVVALPLYIILLIFDKKTRKRLWTDIPLILLALAALYLLRQGAAQEPQELILPTQPAMGTLMPEPMPDLQIEPTPEVPEGLVNAATALVVAGIAGAAAGLFWLFRHSLFKPAPVATQVIADEAQDALDALYAGGDLKETIQICYKRMLEAVAKQRNLLRTLDMTPHEFGLLLIDRGIPARPVRDLTQLFELARYSNRPAGPKEHQQAIHSLSSIIAAIRPPGTSV